MLLLLLCLCRSFCDYNISKSINTSTKLYELNVDPGEEICIDFAAAGAYLVFHAIPDDAEVFYYRQKVADASNYSLDFVTRAAQLPYALRNLAANATYRIIPPTGGLVQICIVDAARCRSGVFTFATCESNVTFGTAQLQPLGLPLGSEKCLLIMNTCESSLHFDLHLTPADNVTVFDGASRVAFLTSKNSSTISKHNSLNPMLIVIEINKEILATREIHLQIKTLNCSDVERVVFLGPYTAGYPTSAPVSGPIVTTVPLELSFLLGFIVTVLFLTVVIIMSCIRYRLSAFFAFAWPKETKASPSGTSRSSSSRSVQRITLSGVKM
jgi:hypothetical protein